MPNPSLVIFDCDGVLVDSERLSFEELLKSLASVGMDLRLEDAIPIFLGTSRVTTMETVRRMAKTAVADDFYDSYHERLLPRLRADLKPIPGIQGVLDEFDARDVPYCVASSGDPVKIQASLETTGLWPRFAERVFSAVQVKNGKPAPDLFLLAAKTCGADPSRCVVIEDSVLGIRAAKAAGMGALGLADLVEATALKQAGADAVISSYADFACAFLKVVGHSNLL